jgi:hypothetical protein
MARFAWSLLPSICDPVDVHTLPWAGWPSGIRMLGTSGIVGNLMTAEASFGKSLGAIEPADCGFKRRLKKLCEQAFPTLGLVPIPRKQQQDCSGLAGLPMETTTPPLLCRLDSPFWLAMVGTAMRLD